MQPWEQQAIKSGSPGLASLLWPVPGTRWPWRPRDVTFGHSPTCAGATTQLLCIHQCCWWLDGVQVRETARNQVSGHNAQPEVFPIPYVPLVLPHPRQPWPFWTPLLGHSYMGYGSPGHGPITVGSQSYHLPLPTIPAWIFIWPPASSTGIHRSALQEQLLGKRTSPAPEVSGPKGPLLFTSHLLPCHFYKRNQIPSAAPGTRWQMSCSCKSC